MLLTPGLCNDNPISASMALQSLPESTFLPSLLDWKENYAVLVGRVIVDILTPFKSCVPAHILHDKSNVMKQKSTSVRYSL